MLAAQVLRMSGILCDSCSFAEIKSPTPTHCLGFTHTHTHRDQQSIATTPVDPPSLPRSIPSYPHPERLSGEFRRVRNETCITDHRITNTQITEMYYMAAVAKKRCVRIDWSFIKVQQDGVVLEGSVLQQRPEVRWTHPLTLSPLLTFAPDLSLNKLQQLFHTQSVSISQNTVQFFSFI